jgi:phytoene dehydrogenase-like protein
MGMTITESGPVSLHEPYSAFTLPLMDSGSIFDGYYGFVNPGLWRLTEELAHINQEAGVEIHLGATVAAIDAARGVVRYTKDGKDIDESWDELILATDPLTAARLIGDASMVRQVEARRFLGTSGKLTLFFQNPVRWTGESQEADSAFKFIFSVDSIDGFERATLRVLEGDVDYEPGYVQIYCEGAAMRQLGVKEPFDRLTLFFKNMALNRRGEDLANVESSVKALVLSHVDNPQDCVWSRLLAPRDLQQLFLFPGGNLDHTMLVGGQTFFDRQYSADPQHHFYRFGNLPNVSYCGAGAYPCGSIAGTPGFMCATQVVRAFTRGSDRQ